VCIRVLGKLAEGGHREVEKAMLSFFNHDDKQVRQAAVRGLKRAMMPGNYTALKQLVYCLKDESWAVRLAAVDAIISVRIQPTPQKHSCATRCRGRNHLGENSNKLPERIRVEHSVSESVAAPTNAHVADSLPSISFAIISFAIPVHSRRNQFV
jgi:hypothetical protein